MHKFINFLNTVKYLKFTQIYFRLHYLLRKKLHKVQGFNYPLSTISHTNPLSLHKSLRSEEIYETDKFTFLNLSHKFENKINWNLSEYGKLWTYNLTYFDFLQQKSINKDEGTRLIYDFIDQSTYIKDGLEPFPISLRGMNWIKFITAHEIEDQKINDSLYAQYKILMDNLEYHLLGNHLLENGFSLLFAAYYYQDEEFYTKAKEILTKELKEQILNDGAHFELSPMYHQLMLFRILDCVNLIQNNKWKNKALLKALCNKAEIMLGWLENMTYKKGKIPLFNDSANGIAPTSKQINDYAHTLDVKMKKLKLSDSGYRKIIKYHYEMVIDVGNIGPDYIPGHAHSDTFNFELYVNGDPVIVDTGLSTYESNTRRQVERSTKSHNTVEVDGKNQSEIWGGFKVANRAKIVDLKESSDKIQATHNGYMKNGILHSREFITQEEQIIIIDSIDAKKEHSSVAYIHFHPNINIQLNGNNLICGYITLNCSGNIELIEYDYSPEFNTRIKAQCAKILFHNILETRITIKREKNENN